MGVAHASVQISMFNKAYKMYEAMSINEVSYKIHIHVVETRI